MLSHSAAPSLISVSQSAQLPFLSQFAKVLAQAAARIKSLFMLMRRQRLRQIERRVLMGGIPPVITRFRREHNHAAT